MRRHNHGIREGSPIANALIYLITGICCLITVYPMYYVLIRSVSETLLPLFHAFGQQIFYLAVQ